MKSHKDLNVWQKSMELVLDIYKTTNSFPKEEIYGLTNQIRRAAVSIPSNIAEGSARNHDKELTQFLYISLGSCAEIETQIILSKDLQYINLETYDKIDKSIKDIRNMLIGLIKSVNK